MTIPLLRVYGVQPIKAAAVMRNKPFRHIIPTWEIRVLPRLLGHHCGVPAYSAFGPFRITEPKQQTSKCHFTRKGKGRGVSGCLGVWTSGCLHSHPCRGICTRSAVGLSLRQVKTYPMLGRNQQFPCNYHNPLSIPTDRTKAHGPSSQQGLCSLYHICVWTVE
jgi:hypothetical protein